MDIATIETEVLVVGSGVAGLSAAYHLGVAGSSCILATAGKLGVEGSTAWAQGGIAAAVSSEDSVALHVEDTVKVSGGLADASVVQQILADGADAIQQLCVMGAAFDRTVDGSLSLGREAGHSVRRVVKANGDSIGKQLCNVLTNAVRSQSTVTVSEETVVHDLVRDSSGSVCGVLASVQGKVTSILAGAVVLATGGFSHCFERTTNPSGSIGHGVVAAARAGADLADIEFVQFHPTALDIAGSGRLPLLTEALRGEGALLINRFGERFMEGRHKDSELAPRDVVARANYDQLMQGNRPVLDARAAVDDRFAVSFPTVYALAKQHGFDPHTDVLPVTPAAHYCMGGIATDSFGRSSLPGLWAIGEVASTGLHGANRLASNSLLEGLVMGKRVAKVTSSTRYSFHGKVFFPEDAFLSWNATPASVQHEDTIRAILWEHVGVVRSQNGLVQAKNLVKNLASSQYGSHRLQTMYRMAVLLIDAASSRKESRGAHYLVDVEAGFVDNQRKIQTQEAVPTIEYSCAAYGRQRSL